MISPERIEQILLYAGNEPTRQHIKELIKYIKNLEKTLHTAKELSEHIHVVYGEDSPIHISRTTKLNNILKEKLKNIGINNEKTM